MTNLAGRLQNKTARIGIVGIGYVGLPLAVAFADVGLTVLGVDVDKSKVDSVNKGRSYIGDVDSEHLKSLVTRGLLSATTDQGQLRSVDAICICVPTPLTKTREPDLTFVVQEAESVCKHLQPGQLVVLESTTYPGTTEEVVLPILERSGLKAGIDFYLAFSPERVNPGDSNHHTRDIPKVVGGINPQSQELAQQLYSQAISKIVPVSSASVAEMTKLFENVFRSVNIALVNELAQLCNKMGISVWEVIDAAATKPYGFMSFQPGPGVGGHCIPLDPYYLASKAKEYDFHTRFIELAGDINEAMPYYVASRIGDALNERTKSLKNSRILVLGITYKKDVADTRESPCLKLLEILVKSGADTMFHDPYVPTEKVPGVKYTRLSDEELSAADCVVIATDHSCFDYKNIASKAKLVFDSRGVTRKLNSDHIIRL